MLTVGVKLWNVDGAMTTLDAYPLAASDPGDRIRMDSDKGCPVAMTCRKVPAPCLMQAVRQLDEHNTTGRLRRDFENETPVTRLLEAIQEQLVPALKPAGYQV